jgi:hypothetical protein
VGELLGDEDEHAINDRRSIQAGGWSSLTQQKQQQQQKK